MSATPITVSVTRTVAPERAKEAAAWARAGQELASASPGYLGSGWIRPDPESSEWHMLYRFADEPSLSTWERSPERAWWVESAIGLVEHSAVERRTGIEGWFDQPASIEVIAPSAPAPTPPRWKQAVAIFVGFLPLSLLANWLLSYVSGDWPLPPARSRAHGARDPDHDLFRASRRHPAAAAVVARGSLAVTTDARPAEAKRASVRQVVSGRFVTWSRARRGRPRCR